MSICFGQIRIRFSRIRSDPVFKIWSDPDLVLKVLVCFDQNSVIVKKIVGQNYGGPGSGSFFEVSVQQSCKMPIIHFKKG